ncbi:ATP-dependent RNA helicase DBP8 [Eremomyces bilateralis CBS 781.70]|uniref:ATP-dependent RNA helicase DBP8 n=1 Tax=Eremomyces bilateralis CBS 781.70 TaxID=1392243 RepID=A0A6G1GEZ4_9PEZI|nr:ATP-dependent RNA helicase DBP8 [Eremomyces bilateralis CBS 781.70]KAF1816638.1 ATP-dependent RNA helicase DBP8 [Eremomyces bilateralis CBS 781.70]
MGPAVDSHPNDSSDSDSSSGSFVDIAKGDSRKRRKVSSGSEDAPAPKRAPYAGISRIRAKNSGLKQSLHPAQPDSVDTVLQGKGTSNFAELNVDPWLVASLAAMQIKRPTGIQKACIPEILKGRDCIGGSRTGSGKTVAFAVPILHKWAEDPLAIFAVVLTPTRELALQIYEQFLAISSPQSLKAVLITGGSDMREQAIELAKRPHVVIATPGRLADHIDTSGEDTICGLRRCKFVVLDEADRLLASGPGSMLPDVETCLSVLPPPTSRQTCLFTATVTPEVRALKDLPRSASKPPLFICEVDTEALAIPSTLRQTYLLCPVTHREVYLHVLLLTPRNLERSIIIFCNRTSTATLIEHMLHMLDHRVTALHSALPQSERTSNLAKFRARTARILVATDVAARGLDIPDVALVINYDVPRDPDDYIHRVGRTARAGREGDSVTVVGQRDVELILAIETRVGRKMDEYVEEGVSIEGRVVRDALKPVTEKKREALLQIEEGKDVMGRRSRRMEKRRT